jgi:hypothetical protein
MQKIQFSPQFFQPIEPLAVTPAALQDSSIFYTPEKYGTWEAFSQHADFEQAKIQYAQIFTDINTFIEASFPHPKDIQGALLTFIVNIYDDTFTPRRPLLYGEGKRLFETFLQLLKENAIPLEKKQTAIRNLSEEIVACADGAINSLIAIVRQLQCASGGNIGEALRIKEQMLEQLIQEYIIYECYHTDPDKHLIAVYHNSLRSKYGLPSLEHDMYANRTASGVTDAHLEACNQYIAQRLTPLNIASIMAEAYLSKVQSVLPTKGEGVSCEKAIEEITALKTTLDPIYGEIPVSLLILEKEGQWYASAHTTLIKLILLRTLQSSQVIASFLPETLFFQYKALDTLIPKFVLDPSSGQFIESAEKQLIRGETVGIYHIDTLWWMQTVEENTPTLLTLAHLSIAKNEALPPLEQDIEISLYTEALANSTQEEILRISPFFVKSPAFFHAFFNHLCKEKSNMFPLIITDLLSNHDLSQKEIFDRALEKALLQLGLDSPLISEYWRENFSFAILIMLLQHGTEAGAMGKNNSVFKTNNIFPSGFFDALLKAGVLPLPMDYPTVLENAVITQPTAVEKLVQHALKILGTTEPGEPNSIFDQEFLNALSNRKYAYLTQIMPYLQQHFSHKQRFEILGSLDRLEILAYDAEDFVSSVLHPDWIQYPDADGNTFFDGFFQFLRAQLCSMLPEEIGELLSLVISYTNIEQILKNGDTILMHLIKNINNLGENEGNPAHLLKQGLVVLDHLATHTDLLLHPDQQGLTPLFWAVKMGEIKVARTILKANPSLIHARDNQGNTPLLLAASTIHFNMMAMLVAKGAEVAVQNQQGDTPLQLCQLHHNQQGVDLLTRAAERRHRQEMDIETPDENTLS